MPRTRANRIELYYEISGTGPRLLFISGTGGDLRRRPNVFDGPLAASFEVLSYDQRGLGQSETPPGPYRMRDYADDAAALLDRLGWDRVPVLGVSFGGMVAQELAIRHPERVGALLLACTSSGGAGGASYPLHELVDLPEQERLERQLVLADTRRTTQWRADHPAAWQRLLELARKGQPEDVDAEGAALQLAARAGHDTWERLDQIRMPVLVAGGRFDGIAPSANQVALAQRIAGAELRLYRGGHLFMMQDAAAYPEMIEWLRHWHPRPA